MGSRRGVKESILRDVVYALIQLIPPGRVTTYSSIARVLGLSPRAVARILASNRDLVVVPCHRVVGSGGELRGYVLGVDFKRKLLELEGVKFDSKGRVRREFIVDVCDMLGYCS
ncbi:MAG: MGMT family protein [Desulfurococcales archaeon]|nr:MGMT family protein [Desulfurococcales archaeon]